MTYASFSKTIAPQTIGFELRCLKFDHWDTKNSKRLTFSKRLRILFLSLSWQLKWKKSKKIRAIVTHKSEQSLIYTLIRGLLGRTCKEKCLFGHSYPSVSFKKSFHVCKLFGFFRACKLFGFQFQFRPIMPNCLFGKCISRFKPLSTFPFVCLKILMARVSVTSQPRLIYFHSRENKDCFVVIFFSFNFVNTLQSDNNSDNVCVP